MGQVDALPLVVWGSLVSTPPLLLASWLMEGQSALAGRRPRVWLEVAGNHPVPGLSEHHPRLRHLVAPDAQVCGRVDRPVRPAGAGGQGMTSAALLLGESLAWWKIVGQSMLVLSGLALNQFGARIRAWALSPR
ncbi:hypothetical protein LP420_02065 [Massilia sp. B-10]|nr:hypothetical protein LP420_02065 [Massilia sp. B-10]